MNLIQSILASLMRPEQPSRQNSSSRENRNSVVEKRVEEAKQTNLRHQKEEAEFNSIPVFPFVDPQEVESFIRDNPKIIIPFYYGRLNKAVRENLPKIVLFRMMDGSMDVAFKANYHLTINDLKNRAINAEEYEWADKLQKLLERHYVNNLIDELKT
jgi:hypothetical protein